MKYLKLFEKWSDQEFYRLNQQPFSDTDDEFEFFSDPHHDFRGSRPLNEFLVQRGFPSMGNSVNFMDSVAFQNSESKRFLWGQYKYRVKIDDRSNLGWSFMMAKNDLFYKCLFLPEMENPSKGEYVELKRLINNFPWGRMDFFYDKKSLKELDPHELDILERIYEFLVECDYLGHGTLDKLKSSPRWGTTNLYAWTDSGILVSKIQ